MPRSRHLSVYLAALCLACAACASDDDQPTSSPTTTAPQTTQSQQAADEQALRDLAEDWYAASDAIYQHREDPARASDFLVDPYLAAYLERATEVIDAGQVSERNEASSVLITEVRVAGDYGTVVECVIDADILRGPDGEVINDEVVASLIESKAVRAEGGWKFAERRTLSEKLGGDECPLE